MILGLFKDKETIQLSKDLAVTFLEAKRALMGLPKNKLNEIKEMLILRMNAH